MKMPISPRAFPSLRKLLLILYIVSNLKSVPFVWHLRVLWHFVANIRKRPIPPKPHPRLLLNPAPRKILTHPLFMPVSIFTRTPLLEADYNFHKSNSTYFSDMDVARTKLVTRLVSPGMKKARLELERQGYKGRITVVLGSVHVSFRREVGIFEKVEIRSRLLGWDAKWLIVVSYFVRAAGKDGKEELCATGLSKYVCKKGRFTVRPDLVFGQAGWLPKNRGASLEPNANEATALLTPPEELVSDHTSEIQDTSKEGATDGIKSAQIPEAAAKHVLDETTAVAQDGFLKESKNTGWDAESWKWEDIEEERFRGLQLAKGWLALDTELFDEFKQS